MIRNLVPVVLILLALATGSAGYTTEIFQDDFEDGDTAGWSTWTCSGTTYNVVGPGFAAPLVDGVYPQAGTFGMHLRKISGAGKADLLVTPLSTNGSIHLSFDIRPFIVSSSTHSIIVGLSENNPAVTETRAGGIGAHFDASGTLIARSPLSRVAR